MKRAQGPTQSVDLDGPSKRLMEQFRGLVRASGFSFQFLGQATGLNHTTISNWVRGGPGLPSLFMFNRALRALGYELKIVRRAAHKKTRKSPLDDLEDLVL